MTFEEMIRFGVVNNVHCYPRDIVLLYYMEDQYDLTVSSKKGWKLKNYLTFWRYYTNEIHPASLYKELKERTINLVGQDGFYDMLNFTRFLYESSYLIKRNRIDIISTTFLANGWDVDNKVMWYIKEEE